MSALDEVHSHPQVTQDLPPLMKKYQGWTLSLFSISLVFHMVAHFALRLHGHIGFPFSLNKRDRFGDFTVFADKFPTYHTAAFFNTGLPILYPSPIWVIFNFFFKQTGSHWLPVYVSFSVLAFILPSVFFARTLIRRGIVSRQAVLFAAVLCLLSWPADLIVDGGNSEVFVWIALATGMWAYATDRKWVAAIAIGLAASFKLFPFIFLTFFFYRRQIGQLLAGVATFIAVTLASIQFTGPTFSVAYRGYLGGLEWARYTYFEVWRIGEQGVDHSLFATIKLCLILALHLHDPHPTDIIFHNQLRAYNAITALAGVLLYFCYLRRQPVLNQILVLTIISIYWTPFSGDGTLIHLYYPLVMIFLLIIKANRDGVTIPGLSTILYCMIVCLSMESFVLLPFHGQYQRLIGTLHCVALGVMLITALRYRLGPPRGDEPNGLVLSQPTTEWADRSLAGRDRALEV